MSEATYPGAVPPERTRDFLSDGLRLRVHEWGDPAAPPLVLLHGGFDHGRGFDLLAPLLAPRFRVLALTSRGHGDSDWDDVYTWPNDLGDVIRLIQSLGRPAHLVGHSRGGSMAIDAAIWGPELVRHLVSIDGFGPPPEGYGPADARPIGERFAEYLDRFAKPPRGFRPCASLDELVERRRAQNPRLSVEWLRYFLGFAVKQTDAGWVWKVDPGFMGGFGPWRPDWAAKAWPRLRLPFLGVTGSEPDVWRIPDSVVVERLSTVPGACHTIVSGAGHFVHMERPRETADVLLEFLPP
jgi:pimeloyl-ACP methyl ester carboxylesterase